MTRRRWLIAAVAAITVATAACVPMPEPEPDPGPGPGPEPGTCIEGGGGNYRFDGPLGVAPNMTFFSDADEPCAGVRLAVITGIVAENSTAGDAECEALGEGFAPAVSGNSMIGNTAPDGFYVCAGSKQFVLPEPGSCLGNPVSLQGDLRFDGPGANPNNVVELDSSDGSCGGEPTGESWTLVTATTTADATAACNSLGDGFGPGSQFNTTMLTLYLCTNSPRVTPGPEPEVGDCLLSSGSVDVEYLGPSDGTDNVLLRSPADGTCSGAGIFAATIVPATHLAAATAECEARGSGFGSPAPVLLSQLSATLVGWWICQGSLGPPPPDDLVPGDCLTSTSIPTQEVLYLGPEEASPNMEVREADGSCGGPLIGSFTGVKVQGDAAAAGVACEDRGFPGGVSSLQAFGINGWWICSSSIVLV